MNEERCIHRGEFLRLKGCPTCRGAVQVKIFACELHERCSLERDVGVKICSQCPDFRGIQRDPDVV